MPRERLIRFALSPDGCVVPDLGEKLPGRGAWVDASRAAVDEAVQKGLFSRAFKASAMAPADLAMQVELALTRRCLEILGRARRASALVTGFDKVSAALSARQALAVLIEAADGASEGRVKILRAARTAAGDIPVLGCFGGEELSLALGRENVIHGALGRGGFAERLKAETLRLSGFRALAPTEWNVAVWTASD